MNFDLSKIEYIYGQEIKERKAYLDSQGEKIISDNGGFNSIFKMSQSKYQAKKDSVLMYK